MSALCQKRTHALQQSGHYCRKWRILASSNPARGRVAVHGRQLDVHQDEIGSLFCDGGERLLTSLRLCDT